MMQVRLLALQSLFLILLGACASHKSANVASETGNSANNPFRDEHSLLSPVDWAQKEKQAYFRLIFSGNVNGQLEPCGCSVNPKGGLDRRLNFIQQQKQDKSLKGRLLIVDAGNTLFPAKTLDKGQAPFQKKRAEAILKAHAKMGVMVQNVGALDFAAGLEFLQKAAADSSLNFVSSNLKNAQGKNIFASSHKVDVGGLQILVMGVSAGSEDLPEGVVVDDPVKSLELEVAKSPESTPLVILSDLGQVKDRELARKLSRAAIIVGGRDLNSLEIPYHEKSSIIVQAQLQGQQWGVMNVAWNSKGQSFYNRKLAQAFERRWEEMQNGRAELRSLSSEDARSEKERFDQAAQDMLAYAPGDLNRKIVYDHKLNDMSIEFAKENELSPLVRALKQKK